MKSKRLNVRVGNYIYTVSIISLHGGRWLVSFKNPDIDSFTQSWSVTAKDVIEYIKEEYPERV